MGGYFDQRGIGCSILGVVLLYVECQKEIPVSK